MYFCLRSRLAEERLEGRTATSVETFRVKRKLKKLTGRVRYKYSLTGTSYSFQRNFRPCSIWRPDVSIHLLNHNVRDNDHEPHTEQPGKNMN